MLIGRDCPMDARLRNALLPPGNTNMLGCLYYWISPHAMTKRRWRFRMSVMDYGESWRWVHIDAHGIMNKSVTCFSDYAKCAANARQHGWPGETQAPTDNALTR